MSLFAIVLVEIFNETQAAGCGVKLLDQAGNAFFVSMIAFVDDIILLAESPEALQIALNIVAAWARRLRMRLNMGINKSAVMVRGKGRLSADHAERRFTLGRHLLTRVQVYRYLGILIGCSARWLHHFQHIADKIKSKTGEIIGWARRYDIPLPVVVRVWDIYVRQAALYGAAVCVPPATALALLDRAQRQAASRILGFRTSVPGPAVLAEVGWVRLSLDLVFQRASFLGRICKIPNQYVQAVVESTARIHNSWVSSTVLLARTWCEGVTPLEPAAWRKRIRFSQRQARLQEAAHIARQYKFFDTLASYNIPK